MSELTSALLRWVAGVLRVGEVAVRTGLRNGGSPFVLAAGGRLVVLRVCEGPVSVRTEVAALELARRAGVPVPEVLCHDDGQRAGTPVIVVEHLQGTSRIPRWPDPTRLHRLGAVAARLAALALEPSEALPLRPRPIALVHFAALRRAGPTPSIQLEAEEALTRASASDNRTVFVHGDLWQGNILWHEGCPSGVVDWDCAGAGHPGVDLGSLRCDAALTFGRDAADEIRRGWEEEAGRPRPDLALFDVMAALSTPPDMSWFAETIPAQGRADLDRAVLLERRDDFLDDALHRLAG